MPGGQSIRGMKRAAGALWAKRCSGESSKLVRCLYHLFTTWLCYLLSTCQKLFKISEPPRRVSLGHTGPDHVTACYVPNYIRQVLCSLNVSLDTDFQCDLHRVIAVLYMHNPALLHYVCRILQLGREA